MLNQRPKFSVKDHADQKSFKKTLLWFFSNDPQVKLIKQPTLHALYEQGIRPKAGSRNDPQDHYSDIEGLTHWFILKIALNLKLMKEFSQAEFVQFLDMYSEGTSKTLQIVGELSEKYKLNANNLDLSEISKIPESQRITFMINYMDDCVLSAELRVMAWIYYSSFGTHYKDDRDWKPQ
jgi:hypothetical protein